MSGTKRLGPVFGICCVFLELDRYVDSPGGLKKMSGGSLVDFAWALVALDLVREFPNEFKAALDALLERTGCVLGCPWRGRAFGVWHV